MAKKVVAKKDKLTKERKSTAKFVSFSFGATIPTQSFGNVQPHIVVEAATYEDARDFAIPKIEALYQKYAELKPEFLSKIEVTEKDVASDERPKAGKSGSSSDSSVAAPAASPEQSAPPAPAAKSKAVENAEKAISLAMTEDAAQAIQDQIEKSVKIDAADKPMLYELCLKKKKELKNTL